MIKTAVVGVVSGFIGAALAMWLLAWGVGASSNGILQVNRLEVVGDKGVIAEIGQLDGAGAITLRDPTAEVHEGGDAFYGICKVRDGAYAAALAAPGTINRVRQYAGPKSAQVEMTAHGIEDLGMGLLWGVNDSKFWFHGHVDPESTVFMLEGPRLERL